MVTTSSVCVVVGEMKGQISALIAGFEAIAKYGNEILGHEAEVLNVVLGQIKPVVKYLDGKIIVSEGGYNDPQDDRGYEQNLEERGIEIILNPGWEDVSSDLADGTYCRGNSLVMGRSGALYFLQWKGEASGYQSEGWDREAEVTRVSRREALKHFSLSEILGGLKRVFEQAIAKLDERRDGLQKRLELIGSLTAKEERQW